MNHCPSSIISLKTILSSSTTTLDAVFNKDGSWEFPIVYTCTYLCCLCRVYSFSKRTLLDGACDVDLPFLVCFPWLYFHILNYTVGAPMVTLAGDFFTTKLHVLFL